MMGKYEESIANFNRALEIESNNIDNLIDQGSTYQKMGDMKNLSKIWVKL